MLKTMIRFDAVDRKLVRHHHNMPESLRAFCSIVSLTAANTSRMFDVSVACVKLNIVSV